MASGPRKTSPIRRSGRSRKTNAKYVNDGWNKETLRLLRESSESSNPTSVDSEQQPEETDDEFDERVIRAPSNTAANADDDNLSIVSGSTKSSHVAASGAEDVEDDVSMVEPDENGQAVRKSRWKQPAHLRSRGIVAAERGKSAKAGVWQMMFGPEVEDLRPMALAKDVWLHNTRDVTLPSYRTMLEAKKGRQKEHNYDGRLNNPASHDSTDSYSIVNSQIRSPGFSACQQLKELSLDEMRRYLFLVDGHNHKVVMGPWSQQQQYDLPYLSPVSIGQAWRRRGDASGSGHHSGWSINVGEKPLHMTWSPHSVQAQYLAVACRSTPQQRESVPKIETNKTPAFTPSASYPNHIQIWRVSTKTSQPLSSTMDFETQPQLVALFGCRYGDIKQISWISNLGHEQNDRGSDLGTIALVTSDGYFRLIYVPELNLDSPTSTCFEVLTPTLQLQPPVDTIFTCFTFATPSDLILGTSLGYVHLYNLAQTQDDTSKIEPYLSLQLQQTYIMSLCTVPEEDYSHFLASTSAAGNIQITDLRSPIQDTVAIPRARIPTRNLICNAQTRTFITTIDSSGNTEPRGNAQTTIVAHNLRHFYTSMALSKYPEGSGTATALAGSSIHPSILMGNTGGTVWAQNVVRRILPTGKPGAKNDGGAWVQKVVEYEWIPEPSESPSRTDGPTIPPDTETQDQSRIDLHHGSPVRPGISRIHHGFKPDRLDLSNAGSKKRKAPASGPNGESAIQVVFEDEQAVTALAWNENPLASTWCAMGWGSGVLLIMDLGHDAN